MLTSAQEKAIQKNDQSSDYIVKILDLWKTYKLGTVEYPALRGVNLSIERGKFVSVVGPSGSGKSTLLTLIGALDRPTRGEILLDGTKISDFNGNQLAELRGKKIGFVFQSYNLVPYLTAIGNIELSFAILDVPVSERREKALDILKMLNMEDKADKKPNMLSGGEQQRIAIARSLANDPSIILADEPTGNLDTKSSENVISILKKFNVDRKVTILMVTHNPELANYTDRIIYMRDGTIERDVNIN
jgi:putative ABC transport system ATP-binding protein